MFEVQVEVTDVCLVAIFTCAEIFKYFFMFECHIIKKKKIFI